MEKEENKSISGKFNFYTAYGFLGVSYAALASGTACMGLGIYQLVQGDIDGARTIGASAVQLAGGATIRMQAKELISYERTPGL